MKHEVNMGFHAKRFGDVRIMSEWRVIPKLLIGC